MILATHSTKSALQELLPNAEVTGGSFTNELPQPDRLSATNARSKLRTVRDEARTAALHNLENNLDSEKQFSIKKSSGGFRTWPDGYTGSLTHKAAIVLSAAIENRFTESLGVDLEYDSSSGKGLSHTVNKGEIPDYSGSKPTTLGVFSTKESVYKAYYPIKLNDINFDDVHLDWIDSSPSKDHGVARCPGSIEFKVQCRYLGDWIISTAQLLDND